MFTSPKADFTGNDVTDDVIMTKINRVLPYLTRNNPVKFHHDRIRFSRVIVFTRKCLHTTDIIITIPLVLPRDKKRYNFSLAIVEISRRKKKTNTT